MSYPDSGTPIPGDGLFEQYAVRFVGTKSGEVPTVETRSDAQRALLLLVVEVGINDFPRVPVDDAVGQKSYERYAKFVEQRTTDPDLQSKTYDILLGMVRSAE